MAGARKIHFSAIFSKNVTKNGVLVIRSGEFLLSVGRRGIKFQLFWDVFYNLKNRWNSVSQPGRRDFVKLDLQ